MKAPVLLILILAAACGRAAPVEEAKPSASAGTPTEVSLTADQIAHGGVRWSAVSETIVADFVELPGRLVVNEDHTARLSPSIRGRVIDVKANLGDVVSRHQVLLILQSEEASARRADLAKATAALTERQAGLNYTKAARERAERLLALKAGSAQDVERARAEEATAQAGLSQAEAEVARAHTALSVLEVDPATGLLTLASPIAGVIVSRDAVVGAVVDAGASTLVVTDPAFLWLEFGAPDDVASRLTLGQPVAFIVPAVAGALEARILRLNGPLDPSTRLVTVRAAVSNPSRKLRPEMFATVRAVKAKPQPAITVPHDAVQMLDERAVVFLVQPDGQGGAKFTRRDVETGTTADGRTHILTGLKPGDVAVIEGAFAVKSMFSRAKMPAGG